MKSLRFSKLSLQSPIHLAGVAGSAMCGLAVMLQKGGFQVVGTDPRVDSVRDRLVSAGVRVHAEQDGRYISPETQLVVASAALLPDHPELLAAKNQGIEILSYPEFLGVLMAERQGVAVAGTHGKTTVTSMVVHCLKGAGHYPGFVIGGFLPTIGTSAEMGQDNIFVAEACEYKRSFWNLAPKIAVITGIEEDHLDVYKNLDEIKQAFSTFADRLPQKEGALVYSAACPNTDAILPDVSARKISFSLEGEGAISAHDIVESPSQTIFDIMVDGVFVDRAALRVPGRHNIANALAAIGVCRELDVDLHAAIRALPTFEGAMRRFQIRGEKSGITVVDDYAHHPTELSTLLQAARVKYPSRRIIIAFQPHQYSRTRLLLDDFAKALAAADLVVVPDIYEARDSDEDKKRVSSKDLVDRIDSLGTQGIYSGNLKSTKQELLNTLQTGDVLITAGAGDIDTLIDPVLNRLV